VNGPETAASPPLLVLLGPTASGKTALSVALAEQFRGEILSCDSVALYRELQIGAAKPGPAERARVPHHLLDVAAPTEHVTAGEYARLARDALRDVSARGALPVVVGGTGLYLRALLDGLFAGPQRSEKMRARLRELCRRRGSRHLHRILQRVDPAAAAGIHPNDAPKLVRALEVCLAARQPMSEMWKQGREPLRGYNVLRLGLAPEREALYLRINRRAEAMFASGLIDETARLRERYGESIWPLRSLGYRQALELIRGETTAEAAIAAAQQGHRNYAKRQMTWFRREPDVHWLDGFGDHPRIQREAAALVGMRLPNSGL
jgi:tRNA dimethylallyltransferase